MNSIAKQSNGVDVMRMHLLERETEKHCHWARNCGNPCFCSIDSFTGSCGSEKTRQGANFCHRGWWFINQLRDQLVGKIILRRFQKTK